MPLVALDTRRIRQEVKDEYDKLLKDLRKSREQLDLFHEHDLPQFTRWLNTHFGALLTEIRESSMRLQEKQVLLIEIEREVMYNGISHASAYKRVMRRRGKPDAQADDEEDDFDFDGLDEDPQPKHAHGSSGDPGFEDPFGHDAPRPERNPGHTDLSQPALGRLKELYRAVVRRLHPDMHKEISAQRLEWWHLAQTAYQKGDAEQLEVILSLCEIEDGHSEKTSVGVLKRLITQFKSTLRNIQHQITKCRRDPAWRFSKRKDLDDMEKEMRRQLNFDLGIIKQELAWVESQVALWSTPVESIGRRPVYRRRRTGFPGFY